MLLTIMKRQLLLMRHYIDFIELHYNLGLVEESQNMHHYWDIIIDQVNGIQEVTKFLTKITKLTWK